MYYDWHDHVILYISGACILYADSSQTFFAKDYNSICCIA